MLDKTYLQGVADGKVQLINRILGTNAELHQDIPDWLIKALFAIKEEYSEQYKCQSYFDDNNVLQDCTCGKCK